MIAAPIRVLAMEWVWVQLDHPYVCSNSPIFAEEPVLTLSHAVL